jgi:transposase-like protein
MSTLSHVHQLFSTNTCHAYLRTLRWKDRPLQCPHCHNQAVGPWGTYHYRPGFKRHRCKVCGRTFNDLTKTLFARSQRSLVHWIVATFLLCLSCSSRRIARELGIHVHTGYRWCWWLRNAALSYEMDRHLEGTIEADELYLTFRRPLMEFAQFLELGESPLGKRSHGPNLQSSELGSSWPCRGEV